MSLTEVKNCPIVEIRLLSMKISKKAIISTFSGSKCLKITKIMAIFGIFGHRQSLFLPLVFGNNSLFIPPPGRGLPGGIFTIANRSTFLYKSNYFVTRDVQGLKYRLVISYDRTFYPNDQAFETLRKSCPVIRSFSVYLRHVVVN